LIEVFCGQITGKQTDISRSSFFLRKTLPTMGFWNKQNSGNKSPHSLQSWEGVGRWEFSLRRLVHLVRALPCFFSRARGFNRFSGCFQRGFSTTTLVVFQFKTFHISEFPLFQQGFEKKKQCGSLIVTGRSKN